MPLGNRLTRETLTIHEDVVERMVPGHEFCALLEDGESVTDINMYILRQRMLDAWKPYTTLAEADCTPQIEIIPFELDRADSDNVKVVAPLISGDVVSLKNALYGEDSDVSHAQLLPHYEQVYYLKHQLFQTTAGLIEAPGSALWYEAFLSQFVYIPPNGIASIGGTNKAGGPQGTFVMVDLDPRFTIVNHGPDAEVFRGRLDFQLLLFTGEGDTLRRLSRQTSVDSFRANLGESIIPLTRFRDQCPLSAELLDLILDDIVETP